MKHYVNYMNFKIPMELMHDKSFFPLKYYIGIRYKIWPKSTPLIPV